MELCGLSGVYPAGGLLQQSRDASGTDREIIAGDYGEAPDGHPRLILGHESLGRVLEAHGDFAKGGHLGGMVGHPQPLPRPASPAGPRDK